MKSAKRLPSPPGTALRVLELCRRDEVEVQEVADVIMSDAALSGRLLKFANSPVSGLNREVTSIREAIMLLGLRTVKLTSLGFSLSASDHRRNCVGFDINEFWAESFASGVIARHLAQKVFSIDREEAFTAALMATIGRMALAQGMPEEYARALELAKNGTALLEAEQQVMGLDHIEFGAQLLDDWGLPEVLVNAVSQQKPPSGGGEIPNTLARAIRAATLLAPVFVKGNDLGSIQAEIARGVVQNTLKLDESKWKRISEEILGEYLQIAELFGVELKDDTAVMDLYAEAQEEASRVGIVAQLEHTEAVRANADLLQQASTDALTGVPNRAKFDEKLSEMVKGIQRGHSPFVLLMLDIDHFKKINDTHGHPGGDLVLKRVGRAVQNCLRDVDLLARYGGEEFAILAPHADRRGACIVAARVRKCVEDLRIDFNGEPIKVTISVGVAVTVDYPVPPSAEQILADADAQLYLSKKSGRNTWSYRGRSASLVA
jgi:diguanylate cyclase (GGDEF)-like protein